MEQTLSGKFQPPVVLNGVAFTQFDMREATVDDLMEAELEAQVIGAGAHTPIIFNGQCIVRQVTKIYNEKGDEFKGVFTFGMLRKLKPINYRALRAKQQELDVLGEAEQQVSEIT